MGGLKIGKEVQIKFEDAKQKPDAKGFLKKKGNKRRNWKKRWFILKDNYVFYCKSPTSKPQGIINLRGANITKTTASPGPFCLSVFSPKSASIDALWTDRTFLIAPKDEQEQSYWYRKLNENIAKCAEPQINLSEAEASKPCEEEDGGGSSIMSFASQTSEEASEI